MFSTKLISLHLWVSTVGIVVATGAGRLSITELQLAGRKILTAGDFINAHSLAGEVFG